MIEANKYLNGHSPDIMNDIFKLRENTYNLRNFHIFQTENPRSLKYGLDAIPYRASQLWQQVVIDIRDAASLTLFKNCRLSMYILQNIYSKCRVYLIRTH